MSKEQFQNERDYQITLSIAKTLLEKGLLTEDEYRQIDTILLSDFEPTLGTLFSQNDLI
ncbi:MAG: SHOCT domain-containing protein [Oscillospiraceae bacterium]